MSSFNFIYAEEDLSHRAKSVYIYLRDRANCDEVCWPKVKTIARELKLSRRTVQRALADLESAGMIERRMQYRANGSCTSNLYLVVKKSA
jgi:predicted transcriptional regulator